MDDCRRTKAIDAYRSGLSLSLMPGRNVERFYDTIYVLIQAEHLPEHEIRILGRATELREEGLRVARAADLENAALLFAKARDVYTREHLSTEAAVCAEAFQTAAESYLQYKREDYAAATLSMTDSLRLCEVMAIEYGYPAELRRVHLARNIAHVRAHAGDKREALRISAHLLQYIGGVEGAWPLPYDGPARRSQLDEDSAVMILDQVLSAVVRLLQPQDAVVREYLSVVATAGELFRAGGPAVFQRAAHCLTACIACAQSDEDGFFDAAGAFFETGRQALEFSWLELERKLRRAAGEHGVAF